MKRQQDKAAQFHIDSNKREKVKELHPDLIFISNNIFDPSIYVIDKSDLGNSRRGRAQQFFTEYRPRLHCQKYLYIFIYLFLRTMRNKMVE